MINSHALEKFCSSRKISGEFAASLRRWLRPDVKRVAQIGLHHRRRHGVRVLAGYCGNFRNHTQIGVTCLLQDGASLLNVFASCYCLDLL